MLTEAELQKIERGEAQYNYVPVLIAEVRHLRGALATEKMRIKEIRSLATVEE